MVCILSGVLVQIDLVPREERGEVVGPDVISVAGLAQLETGCAKFNFPVTKENAEYHAGVDRRKISQHFSPPVEADSDLTR
jgi:hypothetical protein